MDGVEGAVVEVTDMCILEVFFPCWMSPSRIAGRGKLCTNEFPRREGDGI